MLCTARKHQKEVYTSEIWQLQALNKVLIVLLSFTKVSQPTECLLLIEPVHKICGSTGLWVTLACTSAGPSASGTGERTSNIHRAEVKLSVKQ